MIEKRGDSCGIAYINVSSVTHAMRGQKVLSANGIKSRIKRNTKKDHSVGCGYVLSVSSKDIVRAEQILMENGIKVAAPAKKGGEFI